MSYWQFFTFEPLHKIKFFVGKNILLKHYETVFNQKNSKNVLGSAKSMIKVNQSTKRGFSKKALTEFDFFVLFWVHMNPSKPWKGKLEVASFLPSKSMYRQCEYISYRQCLQM